MPRHIVAFARIVLSRMRFAIFDDLCRIIRICIVLVAFVVFSSFGHAGSPPTGFELLLTISLIGSPYALQATDTIF